MTQAYVMQMHWDISYQHQVGAVEQAFRLVELCHKSFGGALIFLPGKTGQKPIPRRP